MGLVVSHQFVSQKADSSDATLINPSNWNDTHGIVNNTGTIYHDDYNFTPQLPGGTLTASIINSVTLTPVPDGINGTDTGHYIRISGGTGSAEVVLITGGTALSGHATGTITFTPANNHSGAWQLSSASDGLVEAINSLPSGKGIVQITSAITIYATVKCWPTTGDIVIQGLDGGFNSANIISRASTFTSGHIFDLSDTSSVILTMRNVGIEQGVFTQTGAAIHGSDCAYTGLKLLNVNVSNGQYGVWVKNCSLYADNLQVLIAAPAGYKPVAGLFIEGTGTTPESTNIFVMNSSFVSFPREDTNELLYGILTTGCDGVLLYNITVTADHGVFINPGASDYVVNTQIVGLYIDGPSKTGVTTTGSGRIDISINDFFINGPTSLSSVNNVGFSLGGALTNAIIANGRLASTPYIGVLIGSTVDAYRISFNDVLFLDTNQQADPSGTCIYLFDGQSGISIQNCQFVNTAGGFAAFGINVAGDLANSIIKNNIYNLTAGVPAAVNVTYVPASTFSNVYIEGDTITSGGTIPSATSIDLPQSLANLYLISGTTTPITTLTGGFAGMIVDFYKTDSGTVVVGGGGNIPVTHSLVQNGRITLRKIGSNWY